jgi:hypothetical protein
VNGPDNFSEANDILLGDACSYGCPHAGCVHEMAMIGRAIAHAIQANTAAVIGRGSLTPAARHEWQTAIDPEYAARQGPPLCRAHPDDCPNGPGPHAYYNPPELEGRCPCCVQPGDSAQPTGGTS